MDAQNDCFSLTINKEHIAVLCFDYRSQAVNTLSQHALAQLNEMLNIIEQSKQILGLVCHSNKKDCILGADITEFVSSFQQKESQIVSEVAKVHQLFARIEALPFPTLFAINGFCLGGGLELALCFDYRIMHSNAQVGLPEVKLGIFPGFAGTVRLPRLIGVDNAVEWICSGSNKRPQQALADGVVDCVIKGELLEAAMKQITILLGDQFNYCIARQQKQQPLKLNAIESMMSFETAKAVVKAKAGKHYPAPIAAINCIQQHAQLISDEACLVEAQGFAKIAKTQVANHLVHLFLNDQQLKKQAKNFAKNTNSVEQIAVIGAGIMGGGIAYQGACKKIRVLLKDIQMKSLDLGLNESGTLFSKQVARGKLTVPELAEGLNRIWPTMSYSDINQSEVIIEAVVENVAIKQTVLVEIEQHCAKEAIICSNTSTISISKLAEKLKEPQRFCGMHFFNPVHRMPLVEIIRADKTSDQCIAKAVKLAEQLGKSVIVVNDCPGFLVNRVLFPYFAAFNLLLLDGVPFERIDQVMLDFGWPMGPAHLLDIVGLDTAIHAQSVMAEAYPDRMQVAQVNFIDRLFAQGRLGQKNNQGFYRYVLNKKGKIQQQADPDVAKLLLQPEPVSRITDQQIIERMMIALCLETLRTLADNIVADAAQADMAMIYGLGFPAFRGGPCRYMQQQGLQQFKQRCEVYQALSPLYTIPSLLNEHITNQTSLYEEMP